MPTRHKRHSVTETPRVKAALDELRSVSDARIDLGELVALGAERRAHELRAADASTHARRARVLERIRRGNIDVDAEAADRVRREGWSRPA